ncbi:HNH endonuclease [Argonema antarcticum]|uniref:HNH endonuclease n=1 Tax=Argonema antarcticum TaxID=2942763 RepID=UPI0020139F12|nr:HNH endonuclease [Argonema antarcticum]MCL1469842.1 HNH endonuclease [Argonema antarcticum A004/B2]
MASVPQSIRQQVISEANQCCEYCQTQQRLIGMPLVIDHIIPRSMGGSSDRANLAASCYRCNEFKSAKTDAVDPLTGERVSLFNPRQNHWAEHFAWAQEGTLIAGLTATGRASVDALKLNNEYVVESRRIWVAENWHPPSF